MEDSVHHMLILAIDMLFFLEWIALVLILFKAGIQWKGGIFSTKERTDDDNFNVKVLVSAQQ